MSKAQLETVETYSRLMNINGASHVLRTTIRLGIIDALMDGQKTSIQLSEVCKLKLQPLELLLAAVVQTGLIEQYGDDYALSQVGRMLPEFFRDLGDRYWQYLEGYVRTGQRIPDDEEIPQQDGDYLAEAASAEWVITPAALVAVEILDIPNTRSGLQILEIGAGSAVFGMAILHNDPSSHLTAMDTERNLQRASVTADAIGKADSVELLAGDYRNSQFPTDSFDMVIMENVLHLETLDTVRDIFSRIKPSLREDGEIVIMDVFPGQNAGNVTRQLFELALHMRMSTGTVHSPDDLRFALGEAGFPDVTYAHLDCPPFIHGLMVAK